MTDTTPLTGEELAAITRLLDRRALPSTQQCRRLVAEVERLRAEVERAPHVTITQSEGLPTRVRVVVAGDLIFDGVDLYPLADSVQS
jgi:hypothetical protein